MSRTPLTSLSLPEHWPEIFGLPAPDESEIATATQSECLSVARHLRRLWVDVGRFACEFPEHDLPAPYWSPDPPETTRRTETANSEKLDALFWLFAFQQRAVRVLGLYYFHAAFRAVDLTDLKTREDVSAELREYRRTELPPWLEEKHDGNIVPSFLGMASQLAGLAVAEADLSLALVAAATTAIELDIRPGELPVDPTAQLLEQLRDLSSTTGRQPGLSGALVHHAVDCLAKAQTRRGAGRVPDYQRRPFASLRVHELGPLARRSDAMRQKYTNNRVAGVFERQLGIAMQSFGFVVIPGQSGRRSGDLICIARDPTRPYSVLVDAKSSRRPYSLPPRDERALAEYVDSFRTYMRDLPPLAFVLVVGPSPAPTAGEKFERLGRSVGMPVRFVDAAVLAKLREELVGPVSAPLFHDAISASAPVVPISAIEDLLAAERKTEAALRGFVNQLAEAQRLAVEVRKHAARP
jgi:hypothetical protein